MIYRRIADKIGIPYHLRRNTSCTSIPSNDVPLQWQMKVFKRFSLRIKVFWRSGAVLATVNGGASPTMPFYSSWQVAYPISDIPSAARFLPSTVSSPLVPKDVSMDGLGRHCSGGTGALFWGRRAQRIKDRKVKDQSALISLVNQGKWWYPRDGTLYNQPYITYTPYYIVRFIGIFPMS